MATDRMTPGERRSALALASIFSFRMLGLFMVLPVFSLYAETLKDVTPTLVGWAIGIYGLTQALLQIPYGMVSDRLGRKPMITVGLLLFAAGSVVAAMSTTIEGIILGRALQGAGAVAAVVMALAADLTHEENRTKAMAIIGMTIGFSFLVAMIVGPILNTLIGVPGIFWLTSGLALLGIVVLYLVVPNPRKTRSHGDTIPVPAQFGRVLKNAQLLRVNFGILVLHMVLAASFIVVPLILRDAGLPKEHHWMLYLPVMVVAMVAAVPPILIAEKKRRMKEILVSAVALLLIAEIGLSEFHPSFKAVVTFLVVFFMGFNLLEAMLPSLIAKLAPVESKGTAMGVYSSSQFVGVFIGGVGGGFFAEHYGFTGVFAFCSVMVALWLVLVITMRHPPYLSTKVVNVGSVTPSRAEELETLISAVKGVAEVAVNVEDGVAYLKVDSYALDAAALNRLVAAG